MNDEEKEVVKMGMEVALRPVTEIAENALGLLGGDWLSEVRARNRAKLKENTDDIMRRRGVKAEEIPSPAVAMPLLSAAQDESRAELQDLWARLLAAALDPRRSGAFRKEFIDLAKSFEPIDAVLLPMLRDSTSYDPTRAVNFGTRLGVPTDHVLNSFGFLTGAGLAFETPGGNPKMFPQLTPKGRQFLAAISD